MIARLAVVALSCWVAGLFPAHAHEHPTGPARVGTVEFPNSCIATVQDDLLKGVAMVHSFWFGAGESTFRSVLARDPGCAIADWGIASILMLNALNGVGPGPAEAARAQAALKHGRALTTATVREQDYLAAVAAYFEDFAERPEKARQVARSRAYEALAAKYPDDDEAQIFSALYIAGTQSQADQSYAAYGRAVAILEPQFARHPDHPGVAHYLIHAYDAPPLAAKGLAAARRYAAIAPDAPHALHMPSHIFTRVGAWTDSVATNTRAADAATRGGEAGEAYHASDYAVYADLQLARDHSAEAMMAAAFAHPAPPSPPGSYAAAAMPARLAVERNDWAAAARLPMPADGAPIAESMTLFARALGAIHTGDPAAALAAIDALAARQQTLEKAGNAYWAAEAANQRRIALAWVALVEHRTEAALTAMREAADIEDRTEKHIVTPGRLLPARELLGDMLLAAGLPEPASDAYAASQRREPNRLRGLTGMAHAALSRGDAAGATRSFRSLLELTRDADSVRPEIVEARAYLAR